MCSEDSVKIVSANLEGHVSVRYARSRERSQTGVAIEGQEQLKKSEAISAVVNTVDLVYFSTLGIPFVEGREFTQDDREISTPVAIINDTMAAKYWPNRDPLGKRLQLPRGKDFLQIVGVVKTANYQSLGEAPQPCIYIPCCRTIPTP
jgi:macrolide transport system ATP-binding/permease protein